MSLLERAQELQAEAHRRPRRNRGDEQRQEILRLTDGRPDRDSSAIYAAVLKTVDPGE